MIRYRDILRLSAAGFDKTDVATSCGCHRNTVANVLRRAEEKGLKWPLPKEMDDRQVYRLLWAEHYRKEGFEEPDWKTIQKELSKKNVTLTLLWQEYRDECLAKGKVPYQRSAFGDHYSKWTGKNKAVMHIKRKPAEKLEVDWAGTSVQLFDENSDCVSFINIFVACLPYSGYIYAEGFMSVNSESWLTAHVNVFNHLGGVPFSIVPDNLKVGVSSRRGGKVTINRAYASLAEHYNTAIIPTRVRKPRDKSSVEAAVGLVNRRALAAFRQSKFFSLPEFNAALQEKVDAINAAAFSKRPGNRQDTFNNFEKGALMPLPKVAFEVCTWQRATVQSNYHVLAEKVFYSVPVEYIKQKADIRLSTSAVEIFIDGKRVATHPRSYLVHTHVTTLSHMPSEHRAWASADVSGLLKQAADIGEEVMQCARLVTAGENNEQIALGSLRRLLNLGRRFSDEKLLKACKWILEVSAGHNVTVESIKHLIEVDPFDGQNDEDEGALLRGTNYYGGTEIE